ncbi:MAG TPA: hypothetical protein VK641_01600 [Terriglobales bacterium]|nr:hypothetical protein [Terriglobales bacterium]
MARQKHQVVQFRDAAIGKYATVAVDGRGEGIWAAGVVPGSRILIEAAIGVPRNGGSRNRHPPGTINHFANGFAALGMTAGDDKELSWVADLGASAHVG